MANLLALIRRWPYAAACVAVMLLAGGGAWYLRTLIADLHVRHAQRGREHEEMLAMLVGGTTQKHELEKVRQATHRIDENLVVEANLAENLWYFYKLEEQTKVRLPALHQLSSPTTDKSPLYRRVPYSLRVTGLYEQVADFLLGLETGPRLVKITGFTLARAATAEGGIALDLNLEMLGRK
jgi:Tfp pilus assembly protein PilO